MKITHIFHSGFLAELEKSILLFDWYTGPLPDLSPDKTLFVFCSHSHGDHYSPKIWELQKKHADVIYILDEGIADAARHPEAMIVYVSPHKVYRIWPDRTVSVSPWDIDLRDSADTSARNKDSGNTSALKKDYADTSALNEKAGQKSGHTDSSPQEPIITIRTLISTDMGVAFYVETEGKRIYHAGDLNVWFWNDEPMEDNIASEKKCREEMQLLADAIRPACAEERSGQAKEESRLLDAAFVPLDPRLEEHAPRCMAAFMEILGAGIVFPMHYWERETETRAYLTDERISAYTPLICFDKVWEDSSHTDQK
jgi:L-ascorbate metabolism protein UlaG (beta-lactamase superfamily)